MTTKTVTVEVYAVTATTRGGEKIDGFMPAENLQRLGHEDVLAIYTERGLFPGFIEIRSDDIFAIQYKAVVQEVKEEPAQ